MAQSKRRTVKDSCVKLNLSALAARQLFLTVVVVGFAVELLYNPSKSYLLVKD
jgi:hypothetical protein